MTDPVLTMTNLSKTFGTFTAVDDVSFELAMGSSIGVIGESGSGKTTVARMIVGLELPTASTITCCGNDRSHPARATRARRARARGAQIVFQDPYTSLDPRQTVAQTLTEVLRLPGGSPTLGPERLRSSLRWSAWTRGCWRPLPAGSPVASANAWRSLARWPLTRES